MTTLDVDAVKAFVAIADLQSFTRAAEALGTTQGAISVKLKRLEDRVGQKLIERTPRQVRLSAQGAVFLEPARDFLAAHDRAVAGLSLRSSSLHAGHCHPCRRRLRSRPCWRGSMRTILRSRSRCGSTDSRELLDAFDRGEIDAAIIRREDDRRDGEVLAPEHFGWFATPDFVYRPGEPLRLAASSPSCRFGISPRVPSTRRESRGQKSSWVVAPSPSPTRFRPVSPPRYSLSAWRRLARSKSAGSSDSLHFPRRRSCCSRRSRTQSLARRSEHLLRPFANIVRRWPQALFRGLGRREGAAPARCAASLEGDRSLTVEGRAHIIERLAPQARGRGFGLFPLDNARSDANALARKSSVARMRAVRSQIVMGEQPERRARLRHRLRRETAKAGREVAQVTGKQGEAQGPRASRLAEREARRRGR